MLPGLEQERFNRWAAEPHTFVRQCFGAEPDPWQLEELAAAPQRERIAIAGSKGCAKTTLFSWLIWWILVTKWHPKVAATSISGDNLQDGLWSEMSKWMKAGPGAAMLNHLFRWNTEKVVRRSEAGTWFASARTFNKSADQNTQAQTLAGIHGDCVAFFLDEAGGLPPVVMATAEAVLAKESGPGKFGMVGIGGNTVSVSGALYVAMTKQRHLWHCRKVTSDPDDPLRTPRVSVKYARDVIKAWGRENPFVKINIFAEFPTQPVGKLLGLGDCEAAQARQVDEDLNLPLVLGVDVSTSNTAIIYPRRGRLLYPPKVLRGCSTIVIAAEVVNMSRDLRASAVFVDAGGPGIGVVDQCRALDLSVVPVYFGGGADEPARYLNKRAEMYVRFATWVKEGGQIDGSTELVQDLLEPDTTWNLHGQQVLEPKEIVEARLGRSPDWGDGAVLTMAYAVAAPPPDENDRDPRVRAMARVVRPQSFDEFGFGG